MAKFSETTAPLQPKVVGPCASQFAKIEARMALVGIVRDNWRRRIVSLYEDPESEDYVYAVGKFFDGTTVVVSREKLSENINFRIAMDYWIHGMKTLVSD